MQPNPLSTNDQPMKWKDAAIVAFVLMLTTAAAVFMPTHGYDVLKADPARFCYDLINYLWTSYITTFATLIGVMKVAQSQKSGDTKGA
jgi:hypothetical protein